MRLDQATADLMASLLELHGLGGRFQEEARFTDLVRVLLREVLCNVYQQAVKILPTLAL